MHATASRRLHLLPQPALPTVFRFQQSDGLAATACVPDVLRLPKGKPLHFTARSHPQTHGKTGTSARAPAFAQPFPPAHTPVCPKTAFISANARLPLSGRRRQAPVAKHPLSPACRLRSARYNRAFPLSRRNTVCDNDV